MNYKHKNTAIPTTKTQMLYSLKGHELHQCQRSDKSHLKII